MSSTSICLVKNLRFFGIGKIESFIEQHRDVRWLRYDDSRNSLNLCNSEIVGFEKQTSLPDLGERTWQVMIMGSMMGFRMDVELVATKSIAYALRFF